MNTLIITLGNSEIQFNEKELGDFCIVEKNIGDIRLEKDKISLQVRKNVRLNTETWWVPTSSRDGGRYILENFDRFSKVIKFPIVENLVDFIIKQDIKSIIWVVTDQNDPKHSKGDTLYYAEIIELYFNKQLQNVDGIAYNTIKVTQSVKDIDFQYQFFQTALSGIIVNESEVNDQIYLFAQGGIDQINHALTLQLLQKYKSQVRIYQKAEDEALKEILFPHMFIKDLNRQKILKHLEDYDFGKAEDLTISEPVLSQLCSYLNYRLQLKTELSSLMSNNFGKKFRNVLGQELTDTLILKWETLSYLDKSRLKIQDLIYSIRIDVIQNQFNHALIKMFTLFENLFKFKVEELTCTKKDLKNLYNPEYRYGDQNLKWLCFLKQIDDILPKFLINKGIHMNNPNRRAYYEIYSFLKKNQDSEFLNKLNSLMESMVNRRNGIAHTLGSVDKKDFNNLFKNSGISYSEYNQIIDQLIGTNGLGVFEEIRLKLLNIYKE